MLLNTVALTDSFMQNDTNISNNPAKIPATTSVHMWLKRYQYGMSIGVGVEKYGRERPHLFLWKINYLLFY